MPFFVRPNIPLVIISLIGVEAPETIKPRPLKRSTYLLVSSSLRAFLTGVLLVPNNRAIGSSFTTNPGGSRPSLIALSNLCFIVAYREDGRFVVNLSF